jgi:hypothetical protein
MKRKMDDRGTKLIFEDNQLMQVVGGESQNFNQLYNRCS